MYLLLKKHWKIIKIRITNGTFVIDWFIKQLCSEQLRLGLLETKPNFECHKKFLLYCIWKYCATSSQIVMKYQVTQFLGVGIMCYGFCIPNILHSVWHRINTQYVNTFMKQHHSMEPGPASENSFEEAVFQEQ